MNSTTLSPSNQIIEAYQRDGFWIAHDLLSAKECQELKTEALRVLRENAKPNVTVYVGVAAASPLYYRLASDPRVVEVLAKIMPDGVMFMSDKFVFKSGSQKFATPWHIDAFYWKNTRPKLSVWIALDDVSAGNGTLKVVRGSHKRSWEGKIETDPAKSNHEFGNVIAQNQWKAGDEVVCEVRKGGAVFFSDRLVHGSCANQAGLDRYTLISTYHAPAEDEEFDQHFPARHVIIPRPQK